MTDETFTSRDGTVDFGKDYEYLMPAYYGLTFSLNNEIIDFKLSTNNDDFGDFDDVIIEATFNNGEEHVFALQLKHTNRPIAQVTLVNKKGNFSLKKYYNEFKKLKTTYAKLAGYQAPFKNLHFVLLSTSDLERIDEFNNNWKKLEPIANGEKLQCDLCMRKSEDCFGKDLLFVSQSGENFLCEFKSEKGNLEEDEFFRQFTLYIKQKTAQEMESTIAGILWKEFKNTSPDITLAYLNYFSYWCRREFGLFKLTRQDVRLKLAELILTSHIPEPNMEKKDNISDKTATLLLQLLTSFDIVLVDKQNDEIINRLWNVLLREFTDITKQWSTPIPGVYVNILKKKFNIPISALNENFSELSLKRIYVLLWHIGIYPLVIDANQQDLNLAIELCENNGDKKAIVLIDENKQFKKNSKWTSFENLSDAAKHCPQFLTALLENTSISLQGRSSISLLEFFETDDLLLRSVKVADFILMLSNNFILGSNFYKKFPKCYINRQIPKILIDSKAIKEIDNDLIVISSDDETENIFTINSIDIDKYLLLNQMGYFKTHLPKEYKISFLEKMEEDQRHPSEKFYIIAKGGCTQLQFDEICGMNQGRSCHHVRFVDEEKVEWIESRGAIKELQNYRLDLKTLKTDDFIQDQDVLHHFSSKLNVICADPGMGKSLMMKFLAFNCPSNLWVIMVSLGEHVKFFKQKRNVEEIIDYFCKKETMTSLEKDIVKIMSSKLQIMFFWDGFDELPGDCVDSVVAAVKILSSWGYPQWLAARNNSKKFLETTFETLALTLTEFTQQNQYDYVHNRLMVEYQDDSKVDEIIDTVNTNISTSLSCGYIDYTGIPLQIHMVVEIYLQRSDTEQDKPIFITLTDIYQQFIEGTFDKLFEKADGDVHNHYMQQIRNQYKNSQMVLYENAAARTLYDDENHDVNLECDELLNELREGEDTLGLIIGINDDQKPIFAHKTYEEFLAALWLSKHWNGHPELVKLLFEEKYSNVRLMFDMLLAENSPIHLAVLYRNLDMIHLYKEDIENSKDKGGRNALHLACSWGRRHPVINVKQNETQITSVVRSEEENRNKHLEFVNWLQKPSLVVSNKMEVLKTSSALDVGNKLLSQFYEQTDNGENTPDGITINAESIIKVEEEDTDFLKILEFLLDNKCKVFEKDDIHKWDAVQYADQSLALAALNVMSKKHKININSLKNYNHIPTLLHYSVCLSYNNLLKIIEEVP